MAKEPDAASCIEDIPLKGYFPGESIAEKRKLYHLCDKSRGRIQSASGCPEPDRDSFEKTYAEDSQGDR